MFLKHFIRNAIIAIIFVCHVFPFALLLYSIHEVRVEGENGYSIAGKWDLTLSDGVRRVTTVVNVPGDLSALRTKGRMTTLELTTRPSVTRIAEFKHPCFLLGRIGDVDEALLNGKPLGKTGSFFPAGIWVRSDYRLYCLPADFSLSGDTAELKVRIQKLGTEETAIYAGPVSIVEESKVRPWVQAVNTLETDYVAYLGLLMVSIGFFYLLVFVTGSVKLFYLYYAITALVLALFNFSVSRVPYRFSHHPEWIFRLNTLTGILAGALFLTFVRERLELFSTKILKYFLALSAIFAGWSFLSGDMDSIREPYAIWMPLFVFMIFLSLFKYLQKNGWQVRNLYGLALSILPLSILNDVANVFGVINSTYSISFAYAFIVSAVALQLAEETAYAHQKVEEQVTERTKELATANDRLRALDKMKERFFANISHDFKTPIAVAFAHVEQVKQSVQGVAVEGLQAAERALNKLQGMIVDILDTMKAESGELKLKWEVGSPAEVLPSWTDPYRTLCERKGLQFNVESPVTRALKVPMDVSKIERVLANLVSNALKFTAVGSITVRMNTDAANLRFEVIDTGPGIPEGERDKVFDRYYQGFNTSLRDHGGSGIGLSFVKEIIDMHHGRVWVEAAAGGGTKFIFTLPLSQDVEITGEYHSDGTPARSEPLKGSLDVPYPNISPPKIDANKPTVLVVEDNPDVAQAVFNSLKDDFNLYFARHGGDAIKLLEKTSVDGVLSDLMMPVMDGTALLKHLRSEPKWQGLPVIILSSRGEDEDIVEHLKLGAQDYVGKPFRRPILVARLKAQIERRLLFDRLLSADKMVTLGLLSSGIAHEIKNPVGVANTGVSGIQILLKQLDDLLASEPPMDAAEFLAEFRERQNRLSRNVTMSVSALGRIQKIVEGMRGFASGSAEKVEIKLAEAVDEAMVLVMGKAKKKQINVTQEKGDDVRILGYSTLGQVFVNLIDNALDALEEGRGSVTIKVVRTEKGATVTVADNGPGIPPDILPHIFDPFMTTKAPDKGTGLGLFISKQLVELQHGGRMLVNSTVGKGTTFTVDLLPEAPSMEIEGKKLFHGLNLKVV